jgi:TM2 domain-containing membrane protein YozV
VAALLLNLLFPGLGRAYAGELKEGIWNLLGVIACWYFWFPAAIFAWLLFAVAAYVVVFRQNNRISA